VARIRSLWLFYVLNASFLPWYGSFALAFLVASDHPSLREGEPEGSLLFVLHTT